MTEAIRVAVRTVFASVAAAAFRIILTPVDTVKTTLQTQGGKRGWKILKERVSHLCHDDE